MARLSRPESLELLRQSQSGDLKARDAFFNLNQPLVKYVARRFVRLGIEEDDLIQEGGIALLKCMASFDFSRKLQFSPYASSSIFGHIKNFVKTYTLIPTERNFHDSVIKWSRVKARLRSELLVEPSDEMINASLNWPKKKIKNIHLHGNMLFRNHLSLDEVVKENDRGANNDLTLSDIIPTKEESNLDMLLRKEREDQVQEAVMKLKDRWQRVLVIRHGLDDGENKTLRETSEIFGISHETIRKNEKDAFKELRRKLK